MIASVHVADIGARAALGFVTKTPKPASVPGLRHANVALAAPLGGGLLPPPKIGRVGLVAFWDDDDALDRFLDSNPVARILSRGWQLRLEPLRAYGSWPGLPPETPTSRKTDYEGPAAVLTMGRLHLSQTRRFLKTSAKAEASVLGAAGLIWATGLARPPFVSTCSLWEDTRALSTYAYGVADAAHPHAIEEGNRKEFHVQQTFIRFRPYGSLGHLDGGNPLAEDWATAT